MEAQAKAWGTTYAADRNISHGFESQDLLDICSTSLSILIDPVLELKVKSISNTTYFRSLPWGIHLD